MLKLVRYTVAEGGVSETNGGDFVRFSDVLEMINSAALLVAGFDGGVGGKSMKPFVEAGVVLDVIERDIERANYITRNFVTANA
jgi:hypothetical protein